MNENPWSLITAMVDGCDFKFSGETLDSNKKNYSFKLNARALTVNFIIDMRGKIIWMSKVFGAATADVTIMTNPEVHRDLLTKFHVDDVFLADGGYYSNELQNRNEIPILIPVRRIPHIPLTPEEEQENTSFSAIRSRIEQTYGQWKRKFATLPTKTKLRGFKEK